jgi:hypothetical protein
MIPAFLRVRIRSVAERRPPDVVVGGQERPYLHRWWLIPRNPLFNVYLHRFMRSDDDRALHDHPWASVSFLLEGSYLEHTIAAGGCHHRREFSAGAVKFMLPRRAHRIELHKRECWTLFITGPRVRNWYFHCPEQGMVPWKRFTARGDSGEVGAGCDG